MRLTLAVDVDFADAERVFAAIVNASEDGSKLVIGKEEFRVGKFEFEAASLVTMLEKKTGK